MASLPSAAAAANEPARPDALTIFQKHAWDGPRVDAWLDYLYCDRDAVRGRTPLGEARGEFSDNLGANLPWRTFTPRPDGSDRAILFPLIEGGEVVDLLAISKRTTSVWATVTEAGRAAGFDLIGASDEPLMIHRNAWDWLLQGCVGVLPLKAEVYLELERAPTLLALDLDHADELIEKVFEAAALRRPGRTWVDVNNAELAGQERIFVDDPDDEIAERAARRLARAA